MSLESRLAQELIRLRPARAAAALDRTSPDSAAELLADVSAAQAAAVVASMSPHAAIAVLERLPPAGAATIFEELKHDVAARLARRLSDERRAVAFSHLPERVARILDTLLRFPENTAGALMDPEVLALAEDLSVAEALERVRDTPDQARYNIYVVDRAHVLVGVVNLRELLLAPSDATLSEVMVRDPVRLDSNVDRSVVVAHPGWKQVHAIPVVDTRGCYLGAVRYRTLRQLEDELLGRTEADASASQALGELFASGASGLLDALTGPTPTRRVE